MENDHNDLAALISKKAKMDFIHANKWQWRILNEYPEDLKEMVYAWTKDEEIPAVEYNDVSYERIVEGTTLDFLDAVDLLYILSKDPKAGYEIFVRGLPR